MGWSRLLLGVATLIALIGIGSVSWPCARPFAEQVPPPPLAQQIESDLELRAKLKSDQVLTAGADPWVEVMLVNKSQTITHRIVKPGHGSEIGRREPHISWSATIDRGNGKWVPVQEGRNYGYCGTCLASASNWIKDAIAFPPGDQLKIVIPQQFEFQQAGRVRLQAHYAYCAGGRDADRLVQEGGSFIAGIPPFSLTSNVVEFDVVRPLDVRVKVKRVLKTHQKTHLSELLDVTLVNQSQESVQCKPPTLSGDARIDLQIRGEFGGWPPKLTQQTTVYGSTRTLKPGDEVPLLGTGAFANGIDGTWEYPVAGRVLVRAVYTTATWVAGTRIMSDWVEVLVE